MSISIKQPSNNNTTQADKYTSAVELINKLPEQYREYVDELYYEFCMHPSKEDAHTELKQVIETLQTLLDTSDF